MSDYDLILEDKILLYEEYRLVERKEVPVFWQSVHVATFFLASFFASICSYYFYSLLFGFNEYCALAIPQSNSTIRTRFNFMQNIAIPNAIPPPWVDKTLCQIPTYMPLVSALFGFICMVIFIMYNHSNVAFTGMRREWRVLVPMLVFSLGMGCLCFYSSHLTHQGISQLARKLNTLQPLKKIMYNELKDAQNAMYITKWSAWLHTCCWLLSALFALLRILFVVDFQLIKISVELKNFTEFYEKQILSHYPDAFHGKIVKTSISQTTVASDMSSNTKLYFSNEAYDSASTYSTYTPITTSSGTTDTSLLLSKYNSEDSPTFVKKLIDDTLNKIYAKCFSKKKIGSIKKTALSANIIFKSPFSPRKLLPIPFKTFLDGSSDLKKKRPAHGLKRLQKKTHIPSRNKNYMTTPGGKKVAFKNIGVTTEDAFFTPLATMDKSTFTSPTHVNASTTPQESEVDNLEQKYIYTGIDTISLGTIVRDKVAFPPKDTTHNKDPLIIEKSSSDLIGKAECTIDVKTIDIADTGSVDTNLNKRDKKFSTDFLQKSGTEKISVVVDRESENDENDSDTEKPQTEANLDSTNENQNDSVLFGHNSSSITKEKQD